MKQNNAPRTLQELSDDVPSNNVELDDIVQINKAIYEQNQKQIFVQPPQQFDPDEQLCFHDGTYICNTLTQYPQDDTRDYMIPFRDLLHDNAKIRNDHTSKKSLSVALMTTYGFEHDLLEPIVKAKIKLILINDNSEDRTRDIIEDCYQNYPNWKLIMPAKRAEGARFVGAYHPKIWFLKFKNFLRIVIGSQNLHVGDWTVWAQGMWVQDFALATQKQFPEGKDLEFRTILTDFMTKILPKSIDFQKEMDLRLEDYEIRGINIRLIPSIPGTFKGNQSYQYGSLRVLTVINEELMSNKMEPFKNPVVTYQSTSLGDLNQNYLNQLISHFTGKVHKKVDESQQTLNNQLQMVKSKTKSEFKLIFPTHDYIMNQTHGGVMFASTLWLKLEAYQKQSFPKVIQFTLNDKEIFHKFEGSDQYYWNTGAIPHIKVFIVTEDDMKINDQTVIYVGSHNLSSAAWGKLEKDQTQINISNTELGVLYPPGKNTQQFKQQLVDKLVFKFPPEKYDKESPFIQQLVKE